ncbi:MAG: bifunctional 5,10-methylene-tetrahydrofolate dehydrogenase/5,10-methylene-tetrahydrofolate cyclohydrolase, partial [Saprospiraceae bacterium]|nr:bifunctional 5,10-methylene-tetrahydrofolate dehydrogenase/5,10-methylene-tetrahydrofolate cyclohydrolase [Saprospiraceae bacterium]
MHLLDGKLLSEQIKAELAAEVEQIKLQGGKIPHLAAIIVGENPASQVYVASKIKSCEQVG